LSIRKPAAQWHLAGFLVLSAGLHGLGLLGLNYPGQWSSVAAGTPFVAGAVLQIALVPARPPEIHVPDDAPPLQAVTGKVGDDLRQVVASLGERPETNETRRASAEHSPAGADSPESRMPSSEYLSRAQLSVLPRPLSEIRIPWPAGLPMVGKRSAIFTLFIDQYGLVQDMVPDAHSLFPNMEENVRQVFRESRFSPGMKDGVAVKSILRIEIDFEGELPEPSPAVVVRRETLD
jgi:hypothetical protein